MRSNPHRLPLSRSGRLLVAAIAWAVITMGVGACLLLILAQSG